mgnify:CR=1 FL=1
MKKTLIGFVMCALTASISSAFAADVRLINLGSEAGSVSFKIASQLQTASLDGDTASKFYPVANGRQQVLIMSKDNRFVPLTTAVDLQDGKQYTIVLWKQRLLSFEETPFDVPKDQVGVRVYGLNSNAISLLGISDVALGKTGHALFDKDVQTGFSWKFKGATASESTLYHTFEGNGDIFVIDNGKTFGSMPKLLILDE